MLEIVDWADRPDVELTDAGAETKAIPAPQEEKKPSDMDDEIPF